jgi:hypothetical protein
MLHHAIALATRGMAVFPCLPRSKQPATPHGFKDATTDPAIIEQWWRTDPSYNVGIATGKASNVFVIDVDGLDAEAELRKVEAIHGALPASVEAITPRPGRHVYFQWPGRPVPCSHNKIATGIDVKGDGGYVLVPPSVHPSGRCYCWSVDSASTFAVLADWPPLTAPGAAPTPVAEWRTAVTSDILEGQRDATMTRIAGHLLRRYIDPIVVLELMHSHNAIRCKPPLPSADIERMVQSIAGRELRRRQANVG